MSPRVLLPQQAHARSSSPHSWTGKRRSLMGVYAAFFMMGMTVLLLHGGSSSWSRREQEEAAAAAGLTRGKRTQNRPPMRYESQQAEIAAEGVTSRRQAASLLPPDPLPLPCDCQHCDATSSSPSFLRKNKSKGNNNNNNNMNNNANDNESDNDVDDRRQRGSSRSIASTAPWLGVGQPPAQPGRKHVRVVIRVHHLQETATRSLIWAMRAQPEAVRGTAKQKKVDGFTVDFALVATEEQGLPVCNRIAQEMWRSATPDVFVADTTGHFYALAANRSAPYRCNETEVARYHAKGGDYYVQLHCAYDNHAYYQATDVAVLDAVHACPWCTHLLVTNSDNSYHPEFLLQTLREKADLVTTDFIDHGERVVVADWKWGKVDLGGVLATKAIVAKTGGFIASLPPGAGPQETHDNDYWLVHRGLELGATTRIVHRFVFFHN